ncbi:MAG: hypothetical protein Q7V57_18595 [Actinomycetota bacterium]|nr:hypothetical protein [Actinomycetota bacterium]
MTTDSDGAESAAKPSVAERRALFNGEGAEVLAGALGLPPRVTSKGLSDRFAFFADAQRLAVVAGPQEEDDVELALAYAVRHAQGRSTVLVLPEGHANATSQRIPWLRSAARPSLFVHRDGKASPRPERSQLETVKAVIGRLGDVSPESELTDAMMPLHLGDTSDGVWELVERVTRDPRLDHGHRRGERSWHFAGQRLLSIRKGTEGTVVTAGIHYSGPKAPTPVVLPPGDHLSNQQVADIIQAIEQAIEERRSGTPPIHRPDEHWLQAIIRRDPSLVGVEQPALRELAAWRPRDSVNAWGRGYIDLLGLDGHGDIRIVETKLADNADDLLVLQGLDYFVWAKAYEHALRTRLGAAKNARLELHYVLGASGKTGKIKVSHCTKPLADALDPTAVRWRFQTLHKWFQPPDDVTAVESKVSEPCEVLSE